MNEYNVMKRKNDNLFFVKRRPNTGLGDLMTTDLNKATLYTNPCPPGFAINSHLWESVGVEVSIKIRN